MSGFRSPTPRQWIEWGAARLAIDPALFRERCDLFALATALEAGFVVRAPEGRREDLAARLTNILWRLLKRPPYKPAARALATAWIEETARLNGFVLRLTDRDRAVLAQETGRALGSHAKVQDWLAAHLVQLAFADAQNARVDVVKRLGELHREPARMFVSCASHGAEAIPHSELAELFARIRGAAQDAAEAVHTVWADGIDDRMDDDDHPLLGALTVTVPLEDGSWARDPEVHCPANRKSLRKANALVICGLGRGSHSTGCEHSEVSLCTPCLYVGRRGEAVPSAVAGALNLRQVDVVYYDALADIPDIVAWWTRFRWSDIERSQRLTELRLHAFVDLATRFSEAFESLTPPQIARTLRHAGLRPELKDTLTSVHGLATTAAETIQSAAAALGFHAPSHMDAAGEARMNDLQLDALAEFQHEYLLSPTLAGAYRREAERQQLLGVLRFSLTSLGEWRDFRNQLRDEAGS
jgi:AraC-like DNA-binding protein